MGSRRGRPRRRDRAHAALATRSARRRSRSQRHTRHDARHGSGADDARDVDGGPAGAARPRAGTGVRPPVPDVHDPAPPGRDHHGECAVRHGSGRAGEGLPLRVGCVRRPDHRDRPHAEDARRTAVREAGPIIRFLERNQPMEFSVRVAPTLRSLALTIGLCSLAACASSGGANLSTVAPNPDPRVGLRAGLMNAAEAAWNLRVVSKTPPPEQFAGITNSDIAHPKYIANVQTCRGSHTHTVVVAPNDQDNVYVYVSGSAPVRSPSELPGCVAASPDSNPNSALFRIEVIKVPLAHPEQAAIVSSPRIFSGLTAPPRHGETPEDIAAAAKAAADWRAKGGFTAKIGEIEYVLPAEWTKPTLDSVVKARGGSGTPTAADSAATREAIQKMIDVMVGAPAPGAANGVRPGPNQCHDITVYPAIGLAGGACGGYGLLLDIRDVANPKRMDAVSDSNFSYWHSATFNNDGTKLLFSDE